VDKESQIMSAGGKTSSRDHRGKMLKPSPRSLLKAIKGATNVTNHALRDRIPRWWTHVNILPQLTIKKDIFHIKLRDGPSSNRSHGKKSVNRGRLRSSSRTYKCKGLSHSTSSSWRCRSHKAMKQHENLMRL
jgi:hypothetical protein